MTTKKIKIIRKEQDISKIEIAQNAAVNMIKKENGSFWKDKTIEELIEEQGVSPVKDEKDFARFSGGQEEWDDIDEFLKYVHRPWK